MKFTRYSILAVLTSQWVAAQTLSFEVSQTPTFEFLMSKHSGADINADGIREIEFLKPLPFEVPGYPAPTKKGTVVVLVESRLLGTKAPDPAIVSALSVMRQDMMNEGYAPRFVEAKLYAGAIHQDGRTMLAVRRFLKDVRSAMPSLMGCILIGDFPDTTLVRRVMFRRDGVNATIGGTMVTNASTLAIASEQIAIRADIVLSDLDGNWEALYVQPQTTITDYEVIPGLFAGAPFPYSGQSFLSYQYNVNPQVYQDFFYIRDENTTVSYSRTWDLVVNVGSVVERNPELGPTDLSLANPIARPEIEVTRINPRHVALKPYIPEGVALDEQGPLATDGKPRSIPMIPDYGPWIQVSWSVDRALERRLILDYLARNHRFRTGGDASRPYRVGTIRSTDLALHSPSSLAQTLREADTAFLTSVVRDNSKLDGYISWLKTSMTVRGVSSHADWLGASFDAAPDVAWANNAVGGRPWSWRGRSVSPTSYLLEPTLEGVAAADYRLYRTVWENGTLANTAQSFWVHNGCSVNSVAYGSQPYNYEYYGFQNHAESLLFFANGMAVLARAKVFYDVPRGFGSSVSASKRFSTALHGYINVEAADPALNSANAPASTRTGIVLGRKRTYFWSVLGDLTLKLRY